MGLSFHYLSFPSTAARERMFESTSIDPERLLEFVGDHELAVVLVSLHPVHSFNPSLGRYLQELQDSAIAVGTVDFVTLMISGGGALPVLRQGLRDCGGPASFGVLPGYWLFRRGTVIGWDAGLPGTGDAPAIGQGAFLGLLMSGLTSDVTYARRALRFATEEVTARRVFGTFREAVAGGDGPRKPPPRAARPRIDEELAWAYQTLGVAPDATDREVQDAWRERRKAAHPDHASQDPVEFERRSRLSADINCARDVIFAHRGTRRRTA
jgi:hypothetical protein